MIHYWIFGFCYLIALCLLAMKDKPISSRTWGWCFGINVAFTALGCSYELFIGIIRDGAILWYIQPAFVLGLLYLCDKIRKLSLGWQDYVAAFLLIPWMVIILDPTWRCLRMYAMKGTTSIQTPQVWSLSCLVLALLLALRPKPIFHNARRWVFAAGAAGGVGVTLLIFCDVIPFRYPSNHLEMLLASLFLLFVCDKVKKLGFGWQDYAMSVFVLPLLNSVFFRATLFLKLS